MNIDPRAAALTATLAALLLGGCDAPSDPPAPTATTEPATRTAPLADPDAIRRALLEAEPGDHIRIAPGRFDFVRSISLNVDDVTISGAGSDATVLSFAGQRAGAEGLLVAADDFTIENLAIEDAKGDALKINESDRVTIRNVRTEWTRGPHSDNGAYGIYPVQCTDVLIEGAVAIGASDAGIYVGQSRNIVVRNSRAEFNVAGIEIENSTFADVHDNLVTNNTGGILVFDLPDLPVQGGRATRVFDNEVVGNNTDNFAPAGNIVAGVPAGTGIMIQANDDIEVFGNRIAENQTASVLVVSYLITGLAFDDPDYDPWPERIHVRDNRFGRGGWAPDSEPLAQLAKATGAPIPDIVWDGMMNPALAVDGMLPEEKRLCIGGNEREDGAAVGFANVDAANGFAEPRFDAAAHACTHAPLAPVSLGAG